VLRVVDTTEISAIVAAVSVVVGVVLTVIELRNLVKQRKSDLLMRLHLAFSSKEYSEAVLKYVSTEYKDYDDFVKKYGSPFAEGSVQTVFLIIGNFFEGIGVLLKNKLVDIDLVTEMFAVDLFWLKWQPLVEGIRKQPSSQNILEYFEYLHNEVKKREQRK
jgi:hypothetical protein